jgi:acetyltransferase-like isoleucine patch superfamily enzyme
MTVTGRLKMQLRNTPWARRLYAWCETSGNKIVIEGADNSCNWRESVLRECDIRINGSGCRIEFSRGCVVTGVRIRLQGKNLVLRLGRRVVVGTGSVLWVQGEDGLIDIQDDATIEQAGIGVSENGTSVVVGQDCLLSYGVEIRTSDSHGIYDKTTGARINPAANVILGRHVWVGARVAILKGVQIGSGSVLGTGSVVTHSIEGDAIAAGVPARVIRRGITWTRGCDCALVESDAEEAIGSMA